MQIAKPAVAAFRDQYRLTMYQQLGQTKFLAGSEYSIADITGMIAIDFARVIKLRIPDDMKNLARWHAEVAARPSAKA